MNHIYSILFCALAIMSSTTVDAQNPDSYTQAINNSAVTTQEVKITKLDYYAGTTNIHISKNTFKTLKLRLRMEIYTTETEEKLEYDKILHLDENIEVICIKDIYYSKAIVKLQDTDGNTLVSKEISDGDWVIHNPEALFFQGIYVEDRIPQTDVQLIERSLIVVPRLLNPAYVTKRINQSINDVDQLQFYSDRLDELKITFECQDGNYEFYMDEIVDGIQTIDIKDIKNEYGKSCSLNNLHNIHFELRSQEQAKPIKLQHLQFIKTKIEIMLRDKSNPKNQVYPNPTAGNLNIEMKQAGTYRFELFNAHQQVYLKFIEVDGRTQIFIPNLTPGVYTYRISNDDEDWIDQLIVLEF